MQILVYLQPQQIIGWMIQIKEGILKNVFFLFFCKISLLSLFCGCSSTPIQQNSRTQASSVTADYYFTEAQHTVNSLDNTIFEGTRYLASRMSANAKVAVASIESPTEKLSTYIADSISMHLVNTDNFTVIEHFDRNLILNEQNYQLSGAVSDETAVSIGRQIGSQFIIVGSMLPLGDTYSLRLKILNVETAQVLGNRMYQVKSDETLLALLTVDEQTSPVVSKEEPQTVINNNNVIITNNNETTINGDVYINAPRGFGGF